ncbi:MAG: OmpA family protein [Gammaproteobacteria bacterium]
MSNIINEISSLVGSKVLSSLTSHLGESDSAVQSGISGMASTILGGMLNKSSDNSAFGSIFDMLNKPDNADVLDNLGSLVGGGNLAQGDPKDLAGSLMGNLFGDKVGGIIDLVSSASGMKQPSGSGLLGLVGPLVMGYLSKRILKGGLNASGLMSLLSGEKSNIVKGLPTGMGSMLGLADMSNINDTPAATQSTATHDAASNTYSEDRGGSKLIPILLGLIGLGALFFGLRNCGQTTGVDTETVTEVTGNLPQQVEQGLEQTTESITSVVDGVDGAVTSATDMVGDTASAAADSVSSAVDSVTGSVSGLAEGASDMASSAADMAGDAASAATGTAGAVVAGIGDFFSRKLSSGVDLNIPENGIENNLINFLGDDSQSVDKTTWFNFDRITFATGSATLDMDASNEQLDNMAKILQAYPNAALKIGGYTDDTGSIETNMKISNARANAVMNALVEMGIDSSRMEAEGYGPAHPVASNATDEGRAQNRRIAVRITSK